MPLLGLRPLGSTGIEVGAIGLGCLSMSWAYGDPGARDDDESARVLRRALELGVTFLDTADTYGPFTNEELIARAIGRADCTIATKGGLVVHDSRGFGQHRDARPEHLRAALDGSLRRLRRDHVDLYYLHRVDPKVPLAESWGAMAEFVAAGKVRALGLCDPTPAQARGAHAIHPVSAIQSEYSLWLTKPETDIIPFCAEVGAAFVPYAPLGQGMLTGSLPAITELDVRSKIKRFGPDAEDERRQLTAQVHAVAARQGATAAQVAIAYVMAAGDNVIPVPGTRRMAYLEENLGAAEVVLTEADLIELRRGAVIDSVDRA